MNRLQKDFENKFLIHGLRYFSALDDDCEDLNEVVSRESRSLKLS